MSGPHLRTADVYVKARDEELQAWVAYYGEAVGVGMSKHGALRSLANDLTHRQLLAVTGDLHDESDGDEGGT